MLIKGGSDGGVTRECNGDSKALFVLAHSNQRDYRPLSALSFAVVLTAVWEFLLIANTQGLIDGGLAGVFWSYIWTFIGFGFVELSLAEMASMAPISGGQYHWVGSHYTLRWLYSQY